MRRLTALTWISPSTDADSAVCKPHPSVREATVAFVGAGRMHSKVTPIKAGKVPWSWGATGLKTAPLHLGLRRGRVPQVGHRGAADADVHTTRGSAAFTPRHSQQLGRRPRKWEQGEP